MCVCVRADGGGVIVLHTRLWRINSNCKKWSKETERRGGRMGGVEIGGRGGE